MANDLTPVAVRPGTWAEYRALWRRAENLEILTRHPLHLDLELTSHCNLRCNMCWQSGEMTAPKGFMKESLFNRIIDDGVARGLAAIKLQSRGESVLHPRIAEYAAYAKRAGVLDVQLTTNGTLFDKKQQRLDDLLDSGLDKLIFSIDYEHDASAREIYQGACPKVKAIAHMAHEKRRRMGVDNLKIRIQTIIGPDESREDRLREIKLDYPFADEYMINELWNSDPGEDAIEGLSTDYEFLPCTYFWTRLVVFWDGKVGMCVRDYNNEMTLGDANETRIDQIWLNDLTSALRRRHLDGDRENVPICNKCEECTRLKTGQDWNLGTLVVAK